MNFFKSVFSDESDSPKSGFESNNNQSHADSDPTSPPTPQPNPSDHDSTGWSFGGLIKTLTTKSESVIDIYRRDLKEFGSGLKKEIEVAHGSLETVGHAIDEIGTSVLKGTAQIISQGKDAILAVDHESDSSDNNNNERSISSQQNLNSKPYSRFDAQVRLIQGDVSTYCEEPEDLDDYKKWKLGFVLEEKREDFESLIRENSAIESVYKRVVPTGVDEETFWCRYCYKVFKLKQAEDLRANLVKRAISAEEEDLSWDVDDDDDDEPVSLKKNEDLGRKNGEVVKSGEINKMDDREFEQSLNVKEKEDEIYGEEAKEERAVSSSDNVASETVDLDKSKEVSVSKSDEKAGSEGKADNGESSKDSDFSVISSHPSMPEEEDLGWDEIEDLSSIDEKKATYSGSPNKADLRRRLSAAEEEEDLSWDIEDDDEPVKA
ncbi:BSD domain-containing protein 1 [Ricinus communis]|uniref:Synapse-associated protein, putative n=1 Tax=Ricinus communis TaxID=3988 RepID=B9SFN4_RICCO|nr:BSD domain-containing protein 1 [Ricinus communis]EEF37646.1 synapse-associated protein, putative [Ricinus communis]|eukprot:XP_002524803.1 BSD domain-containing protein 1 [Ricinus communis]